MTRNCRPSLWMTWLKWRSLSGPWARRASARPCRTFTAPGRNWQQLRLRDQELFVNDQELNSQYLDLTTKASRLVKLLDDAENARNAKEVGSALGKYMEAKKLYLHSRFAKEGIESLLDEVLPLK